MKNVKRLIIVLLFLISASFVLSFNYDERLYDSGLSVDTDNYTLIQGILSDEGDFWRISNEASPNLGVIIKVTNSQALTVGGGLFTTGFESLTRCTSGESTECDIHIGLCSDFTTGDGCKDTLGYTLSMYSDPAPGRIELHYGSRNGVLIKNTTVYSANTWYNFTMRSRKQANGSQLIEVLINSSLIFNISNDNYTINQSGTSFFQLGEDGPTHFSLIDTSRVKLYFDTDGINEPIIVVNSPSNNTFSNQNISASVNISDVDGDLMNLTFYINNTPNQTSLNHLDGTFTLNSTLHTDGHYSWHVQACDPVLCVNSTPRNYIYDITGATFSNATLSSSSPELSSSIDIFVNVTDVSSNITSVVVEVTNPNDVRTNFTMTFSTGDNNRGNTSKWFKVFTNSVLGLHQISYFTTDNSGNFNSSGNLINFTSVAIVSPGGGGGGGPSLTIVGNVSSILDFGTLVFSFTVIAPPVTNLVLRKIRE